MRCHKAGTSGGGSLCADCRPVQQTEQNKARVKVKAYDSATWRNRFAPMMKRLNPICTKLELNYRTSSLEQCHTPTSVIHHLRSPREYPEGMFKASNVISLCARHHPPLEGTPDWREGVDFVANQQPKYTK
jgi:hypothetical protein